MNHYYIAPIIIGSVSVYYGYYYCKKYIQKYVLDRVMEELNKIQDDQTEIFKPLEKSKSAIILYNHGGKNHNICVPYDRSKSRNMLRKEVYLIKDIDGKINITHKPGIPYLLSAKDMGGIRIVVSKDGQIIREYGEDEIPRYLE